MKHIAPLAHLIEHFRALPGIGAKTATRLAYHVLDMDAGDARALAEAIIEAKEKIGLCNTCFNLSDRNPCMICASDKRDRSIICVVEQRLRGIVPCAAWRAVASRRDRPQ